jgi:hypothetical protein
VVKALRVSESCLDDIIDRAVAGANDIGRQALSLGVLSLMASHAPRLREVSDQ